MPSTATLQAPRRYAPRCVALLLLSTLTGAATGQQAGSGGDCFRADAVQRWEVLDELNLLVFSPDLEHAFHVGLIQPCTGLGQAREVGFATVDDWICSRAYDEVRTRENECPVKEVAAVPLEQLPEWRARFGPASGGR
ncbi:MAG TPA: DUF6491 family protein [Gammaproteobacteria bacterium]